MNRILLLVASALISLKMLAQTEVKTYQPGITEEGVTYFLPQTQIRVLVTATRIHHTPGEYCDYAERFLRLKNVTKTPYDEWNIEKIELVPYGIADKTKAYSIKLKSKTSAPLVELTNDGRLIAINAHAENQEDELPMPQVIKDKTRKINGESFKSEEILSAGSVLKMAELTADEIYDIRESRSMLAKGQADFMPKDGEQLKIMLTNLETQEKGLMQLFAGETTRETHIFAFDINAQKDIEQLLLFAFSRYLGIVDATDPAGVPYYISIKDLNTLPEALPTNGKAKKEVEDVRYIIPSRAEVRVYTAEKELLSSSIPMAQFGRIEHLGGDLFNKKNTTHVWLSPVTGNIVKIDAAKPE